MGLGEIGIQGFSRVWLGSGVYPQGLLVCGLFARVRVRVRVVFLVGFLGWGTSDKIAFARNMF